MAQELKTREDFVRVAKALKNRRSKPFQYRVKEFGWCCNCGDVTEYDGSFGPETTSVTCKSCKVHFTRWIGGAAYEARTGKIYTLQAELGSKQINVLHSRAKQKEFFLELLGRWYEHCVQEHAASIRQWDEVWPAYAQILNLFDETPVGAPR